MPHFCQDPPSGSSDLMAALHHQGVAAKARLARSAILDLADAAPAVLQDKDALGSFVSILTTLRAAFETSLQVFIFCSPVFVSFAS